MIESIKTKHSANQNIEYFDKTYFSSYLEVCEMEQTNTKNKFGKIKIGIGVVLSVLLSVLLICNLVILIKGTLNPEKPPSIFGVTPMVVLSGSMSGDAEDHIEVGDLIFVTEEKPENLKVGDVVSYLNGSTMVTHRITAVSQNEDGKLTFTTKGDANQAEDTETVTEEQLVGLYRARIPKVGDFVLFLQQPIGMLLFIGIPLLAFIIYDILRRQRYASREKTKVREMEAELARLRSMNGENQLSSPESNDLAE
ncbi:MAG: signal peptidase I [Massiliimalia sp.]